MKEDTGKAEESMQQAEATTVSVGSTEEETEAAASQALTYVSNVNTLQLVNLDLLYWGEMSEENPRALRLLLGDELLFRATTPVGEDQHYISWSVTELCVDETSKEKALTGQTIHLDTTPETTSYQAHPTTHRAFSWEPSQVGFYLISAARTPKDQATKTYYSGFYYTVEVVDTLSFTSLTINQPPKSIWVVGDSVVITLRSTVKLPPAKLERLRLIVRGTKGSQSHQTAMVFTATGAHTFQQEGCCLQATFPTTNANSYQVDVFEDHRPLRGITPVYFQVHDNAVLSISPAAERIRLGSTIVFTAAFRNQKNAKPFLVKWRIQSPGNARFEEHLIKNTSITLHFSLVGTYVVECVYGHFLMVKDKVRQTIRVVDNKIDQLTLSPSLSKTESGQTTYTIYCQDWVTMSLGMPLGYQPPSGAAYVEVKELASAQQFQHLIRRLFSKEEAPAVATVHDNVDSEITYTLTYSKGPKKKSGFGLSISYADAQRQAAIQAELDSLSPVTPEDTLEHQSLEGLVLYPVHTQTEGLVLRSNLATLTFQLEELGTYRLDIAVNEQSYTYQINCIAGKVNRWEFVNAHDQQISSLSFNSAFSTTVEITGYENRLATICYWYDSRNRARDIVELHRDTIHFDPQGKGTHQVLPFSNFWKTFEQQVPEGKGEEYAIFFTLSEEVSLSNVKRDLFEQHEGLLGHVFPMDTVNTYGYIPKKYRIEAYFNTANHRRLFRPILYKEPMEVEVIRVLGRYDHHEILPDTVKVTLYENTNQRFLKLVFKDREAASFSLAFPKGEQLIYHPLDTSDHAIYKGNTHKKDKGLGSNPRVFYLGISYEAQTKDPLYGQTNYFIDKRNVEVLYPKGYERNGANDRLLMQPFKPEIEKGLPRTEAQKRAKENLQRLAAYHKDNKQGYLYLHQLKLVQEFVFRQTFKEHSVPIVVERRPTTKQEVVADSHSDCPRCKAPVTSAQLMQLFPGSDAVVLEAIAKAYTDYMAVFEMNTCWNKAHFFAQAVIESGRKINIKKGESFAYDFSTAAKRKYFLNIFCSVFFKGKKINNK